MILGKKQGDNTMDISQSTLNNFSVIKDILAFFSSSDLPYKIIINKKNEVCFDLDICPLCNSSLSKNGANHCKDKLSNVFGLNLKKGRMICSNHKCTFKLNVPTKVFNKWFSKLQEWIDSMIISLGTKKVSPSKIEQFLKETSPISFCDEYIRKKLKELLGYLEYPNPKKNPSDVIVVDEQFLKIKGDEFNRISILDANNCNVYYDKLHNNRKEKTYNEIIQQLKDMLSKIRAAVTDGYPGSRAALKKIFPWILLQYCLFHFAKNVRDAYKDEVGYGKGNSCLPLEHLIGFFSIMNCFFDHAKELIHLRELQNELNEHINRINEAHYTNEEQKKYIDDIKKHYSHKAAKYLNKIRKARRRKAGIKLTLRTEEQAKGLLEEAKKFNRFPKKVQKQINRLEKEWEDFTHCLRDQSIPPTSNKNEQYYAQTLNWIEKNNLQSIEQFYQGQKISLMQRYNIPFLKEGIYKEFMQITFALLLVFAQK